MLNSKMIKNNNKHTAIVAHDAGAAAHILAWLKSGLLNIKNCKFCLDGPAAKLFRDKLFNLKLIPLEDILTNTKVLLTGSGWSSSLEYTARMMAKDNGVKSIAVIDHWMNYKERFIRNNLEILPDLIWVSDKYAYLEAKRCFPNIEIVEQRNDYIKSQIDEVLNYNFVNHKDMTNVLYLSEPLRDPWANVGKAGEFQALDFFIKSIPNLNLGENISIILKLHPSDPLDKYDQWVSSISLTNIYIEKKKSLPSLLAWSDVVVGCETYAMVVALAVNKRVISSLPKNAPNCRLPFHEIERLNQIQKNK